MKFNSINLILIVVFLFIISSVTLVSNTVVMPYSESTIFSKEFPYEGFSNYGNLDGGFNTDSVFTENSLGCTKNVDCLKVQGIDGLFCKPYVADKPIDKFSALESNKQCTGKSSGLSNSMGGLCLDANMEAMLKTRGGNASGSDSNIGGCGKK